MRLCIHCHKRNTYEAASCARCGVSLVEVPTGEEAQRRREQPLTATGIVYLFGDQFAKTADSEPARLTRNVARLVVGFAFQTPFPLEPAPVRVPHNGQQVRAFDLARKLLEAAFVSLAQEGYISLWLDDKAGLLVPEEAVSIGQERSRDDLPLSLERSIMGALAPAPQRHWLKNLVPWLGQGLDPLTTAVDIVAEALIQTGWLQRGVVGGKSVHRKPSEEAARLLAALTGEAETVKAWLESFATQNPRLHAQMMEGLRPPE